MKKEKIFWAKKGTRVCCFFFYYFYTTKERAHRLQGDYIFQLCARDIDKFSPKLKIKKNQICKYKLTQLKNGIKLEKVGKPS